MNNNFEYPRDFKGIFIPKEVWLDDELGAVDKFILAELDSLDVEGSEGCYASNEYLANFCKCSVTKVSTSISKLIGLGYVRLAKSDGRKRYLKVSLSKFESQTNKKRKSPSQKMKQSNISSNIPSKIDNNINNIHSVNNLDNLNNNNIGVDTQRVPSCAEGDTTFSEEKEAPKGTPKKTKRELKHEQDRMVMEFNYIVHDFGHGLDYDNVCECFKYYMAKYNHVTGRIHPRLRKETLVLIAETLLTVYDDKYGNFESASSYEHNYLIDMVNDHFRAIHNEETDWHISHFANSEYLVKIAQHIIPPDLDNQEDMAVYMTANY
jgi:hypothetical protein